MAGASDRDAYNPGPTFSPDGWLRYKAEVWGPEPARRHLRVRPTADGFGPPERDPLLDPFDGWRDDVRIWDGTLSPDGRLLVLGVSELDPGTGRPLPSDLWVAVREGEEWGEPKRLPSSVNSPDWENFVVFTPDGGELLFARGFTAYYRVPVASLPGA
jgi:hypothetical protein